MENANLKSNRNIYIEPLVLTQVIEEFQNVVLAVDKSKWDEIECVLNLDNDIKEMRSRKGRPGDLRKIKSRTSIQRMKKNLV